MYVRNFTVVDKFPADPISDTENKMLATTLTDVELTAHGSELIKSVRFPRM